MTLKYIDVGAQIRNLIQEEAKPPVIKKVKKEKTVTTDGTMFDPLKPTKLFDATYQELMYMTSTDDEKRASLKNLAELAWWTGAIKETMLFAKSTDVVRVFDHQDKVVDTLNESEYWIRVNDKEKIFYYNESLDMSVFKMNKAWVMSTYQSGKRVAAWSAGYGVWRCIKTAEVGAKKGFKKGAIYAQHGKMKHHGLEENGRRRLSPTQYNQGTRFQFERLN